MESIIEILEEFDSMIIALMAVASVAIIFLVGVHMSNSSYETCKTYVYQGDIKSAQVACYEYGWKPKKDKGQNDNR